MNITPHQWSIIETKVKTLSEYVGNLIHKADEVNIKLFESDLFTNEMVVDFDVFGASMKN